MQNLIAKTATLLEALPYIQQFSGATFVIKYGGSFMDSPDPEIAQRRRARHRLPRSRRDQPGGRPRRRQSHHPGDGEGRAQGQFHPGPACHRRSHGADRRRRALPRDQSRGGCRHQLAGRPRQGVRRPRHLPVPQGPREGAGRPGPRPRLRGRGHRREHCPAARMHRERHHARHQPHRARRGRQDLQLQRRRGRGAGGDCAQSQAPGLHERRARAAAESEQARTALSPASSSARWTA